MKKLISLGAALLLTYSASALTVTLGTPPNRTGTLTSAEEGIVHAGNVNNLNAPISYQGYNTWVKRGEVVSSTSGGLNDIFKVTLTSGSWGGSPVSGTWEITDANFWSTYNSGAISLHVGGGSFKDYNAYIWLLTPNLLQGTFSIQNGINNGGGLSNLFLYGSPEGSNPPPTTVPDSGTTLVLLGAALLGLAGFRNRKN